MSEIIFKYILKKNASNEIYADMPSSAKIISIGYQKDNICLWAIVESGDNIQNEVLNSTNKVLFNVYPTGIKVDKVEGKFLGTVIWPDGSLVFHVHLRT